MYRIHWKGTEIHCEKSVEVMELLHVINGDDIRNIATDARLKVKDELLADLERRKDVAYGERDRLVAALSKLLPSHLARHPEGDAAWERDWMNIVCIHLPAGPNSYRQATWHIHDSETGWFEHLQGSTVECHGWDGHTTEEKYERLDTLKAGGDLGEG